MISPSFFRGASTGHDFDFHLSSWIEVAQQWRQGVVFPRWAAGANWGYGDARFIFYPPLSRCLGAALGLVLPWRIVPSASIFLGLVLAGLNMHRLARGWMPPEGAVVAAVLYAANPYHLLIVYLRSDFSELLASALFPLCVHYVFRCSAGDQCEHGIQCEGNAGRGVWGSVAALAVVYGAIWLSNAPAAVVASYGLALLFVLCAIMRRSLQPLLCGVAAVALGLMLAGVYIVPAALEQGWVNIEAVLSPSFRPEDNFLFTSTLDPAHKLFNLLISTVACLEIGMAGVGAVFSRRRDEHAQLPWMAMLGLAAAATALMFPMSRLMWRYAPKLQFVQFTWRWLVPLGVSLAFFLGRAFAGSRHRLAIGALATAALLTAILVAASAGTAPRGRWNSEAVMSDFLERARKEQGYEGAAYVMRGGNPSNRDRGAPRVALLPAGSSPSTTTEALTPGSVSVDAWRANQKTLTVDAPQPVRAALHLLNYPAWQVRVNGLPVEAEADSDTGQMLVPLPEGRSRVEVRFVRTADRTAGGMLSGFAAVLLVGMVVGSRRIHERRLRSAG